MSSSTSSSSPLIVYFSPLSMPSRAVKHLLLEANIPAEYRLTNVVTGDTKTPEYLAINPVGQIPTLVDEDFTLTESSAILQYIVNKYHLSDWNPTDLRDRARMNQYLHWHPSVRAVFARLLIHSTWKIDPEKVNEAKAQLPATFAQLERYFSASRYVGSSSHPTIADLQLFHELIQPFAANLFDFSTAPKTLVWFEEMRKRPATIQIVEEMEAAVKEVRAKLAAQSQPAPAAAPSDPAAAQSAPAEPAAESSKPAASE